MMDEIARWQQAIYELCQEHYPDVDGSGCDSGDELDLTLADISEVFNMYQDRIDELEQFIAGMADLASREPTWVTDDSYAAQKDMRERIVNKIKSGIKPSPWDNDASAAELPY